MKLLLTLPYCVKDAPLLKKCLAWIGELNRSYDHHCLLVADLAVPHPEKLAIQAVAKALFLSAETAIVTVPEKQQKWPDGPNVMFAAALRHIAEVYRLPALWFEPDAVPLTPGWLDSIAMAYVGNAKRFMGTHVPSNGEPDLPPVHLSGVSVYSPDAYLGLMPFTNGPKAFDIASASYAVPRSVHTPLLQHFWGKDNLAPTFKAFKAPTDTINTLTPDDLKPDAVVFHRCKDGSLIDVLREKANSRPVVKASVKHQAKAAPARTASSAIMT